MTDEEAWEQADRELRQRAGQMTQQEYNELVVDRARELAGRVKMARLSKGKRLTEKQLMALIQGVDKMLNDFTHVAILGDARIVGSTNLLAMFRLTQHMDIGWTVQGQFIPGPDEDFFSLGQAIAVDLYDSLTPERVAQLLKDNRK
jgi:hypothetical protein